MKASGSSIIGEPALVPDPLSMAVPTASPGQVDGDPNRQEPSREADMPRLPPPESSSSHATADHAFTCDHQARLLFANPPLLALWNLTATEAAGRPLSLLPYPANLGMQIDRQVRAVLRTGRPTRDQVIVSRSEVDSVCHDIVVNPVFGSMGQVRGVAGSSRITVRRHDDRTEVRARRAAVLCEIAEELFLSEDRRSSYSVVFEQIARTVDVDLHLQQTVAGQDPTGEASEYAGISAEQIGFLVRAWASDGPPDLAIRTGTLQVLEENGMHPDRRAEPLRALGVRAFACYPLKADGRVLGTACFGSRHRDRFTDGEMRFLQTAVDLVAASMDRRRLLAELRASRDLAEQASHAKDNFLATLSHELRTPLNPVLLLASNAAGNAALPAAVRADFETIARSVLLQTRLIDDLLDLTRITHGKLTLAKTTVDLHAVLREAIETVRGQVDEKPLTLVMEFAAGIAPVLGDPVRLQQVFWNILKNAVKFTPAAGRIQVRTGATADGCIRVDISDTGIGLTADELACAFDAFAQGNHARSGPSAFGGLGLGLAITRRMISLHAGRISVTSAGRGQGACFTVELPLAGSAGEPSTGSGPSPRASVRHHGLGARVLLVEDHQPTRQALLQLLVHRHYEVIAAGGVQEARAAAARKHFDLVICDIGLPDGSGYDLVTELQAGYGLRGIALTGYGSEQDLARARAAGFIAHLTKPVSIQSLESALESALAAR